MDTGFKEKLFRWCSLKRGGWKEIGTGSGRDGEGFPEHVDLFASAFSSDFTLGSMPADLLEIVSEIVLGSPTICAARALHRIAPSLSWDDPALLSAAATVANGFRSLFNNPDSQLLIRHLHGQDIPLWRATLHYAIDGNLQAVLDEYAHVLKESLGLFDHADSEVVKTVAASMHDSLSLRMSSIAVDQLGINGGKVTKDSFRMRCRFALRFADLVGEKDSDIVRAGTVREAFNSPFRPFVLASTSIGQEGLDFHTYCHEIWHWNFEDGPNPSKVRRVIPMLPFSREQSVLERLKKSLALYRLAFGQPRQEELLEILGGSEPEYENFKISLQP